jgi:hypothetical protein
MKNTTLTTNPKYAERLYFTLYGVAVIFLAVAIQIINAHILEV